jgi:hypothetical protein
MNQTNFSQTSSETIDNYIDYSAPYFIGYNGPLSEYNYNNAEYGDLLNFLKDVNYKERIWLCDTLFFGDTIPPQDYDTYIICCMGEYLNKPLLDQISNTHVGKNLILLTTISVDISTYKIFPLEHLHTLVPFFNKGGVFKPIAARTYTNSILTRRTTPYKEGFTQLAKQRCENLIYSSGIDNPIDTYDQWSLLSKAYSDTKFHWANETLFSSDRAERTYLTEKTFKPIASKTPFAIVGQAGSHDKITQMGFQTYEGLIGKWDSFNDTDRVDAITNAMSLITDEFILDNIHEFQLIAEYNYNHFINNFHQLITKSNNPVIIEIIEYLNNL